MAQLLPRPNPNPLISCVPFPSGDPYISQYLLSLGTKSATKVMLGWTDILSHPYVPTGRASFKKTLSGHHVRFPGSVIPPSVARNRTLSAELCRISPINTTEGHQTSGTASKSHHNGFTPLPFNHTYNSTYRNRRIASTPPSQPDTSHHFPSSASSATPLSPPAVPIAGATLPHGQCLPIPSARWPQQWAAS